LIPGSDTAALREAQGDAGEALASVSTAPGGEAPDEAEPTSPGDGREAAPAAGGAPAARLVVYNAEFRLLVANVDSAIALFVERVDAAGGYLESRRDGHVVCRVPAASFRPLAGAIAELGTITQQRIDAVDVTRSYRDLEIRLRSAEATLARLTALLERAGEVEDVLRIEAEMRRLTEEIDRLKAELTSLADRIAFSTIVVRFESNAPAPVPLRLRRASPFPWIHAIGPEHVLDAF
jgi:hypothetical protein